MIRRIAEGVQVHESACIQSNAVIVQGEAGVLLVDPGITRGELAAIAGDLRDQSRPVVAGFSTHPDWDHALWHPGFGDAPRYGTARCAASLAALLSTSDWESRVAQVLPPEFADDIPMELLGRITALPEEAALLPWEGPRIRIIEHQAHAEGHAALLVEGRGVLVAGDMLSDVLVPILDLDAVDPIEDYLAALRLLEGVAGEVSVVVPGHGSIGDGDDMLARIERDRAYVEALRRNEDATDLRIGPAASPGWEWVSDVHAWQRRRLTQGAGR
ncbi:MBL fold metallo-hydrolase [Rathayibacter sp. YIM 133350]|uniref:MBL fold metallo-hydrolase n=1 Tax=Rathayibacter sp. YIM 133350 TaxID=3131992 RepID=UPI00307F116A